LIKHCIIIDEEINCTGGSPKEDMGIFLVYDAMLTRYTLRPGVCHSFCLSEANIIPKWLNIRSWDKIAQKLYFSDAIDMVTKFKWGYPSGLVTTME